MSQRNVRSHVETDQRAVALTLDDGYDPDPRVLGLIKSYGIHGTAFIVGAVADSNPGLLNELARLGWLVCSHTYDHEYLPGRSAEAVRSTIVRGADAAERVVGYRCPYFRAPYGAVDATVVSVTDSLGLQLIGWETSISDSAPRGTDPDLQLDIAKRSLREGSIVLGHFGGTNSYEVLSRLLSWLFDEGYRVGSVAELIDGTVGEVSADTVGSASVSVELPGDRTPVARSPASHAVASHRISPRAFAPTDGETVFGISVAALLLVLPRQRFVRRRWRRDLGRLAISDASEAATVWEASPAPVRATTEGWT